MRIRLSVGLVLTLSMGMNSLAAPTVADTALQRQKPGKFKVRFFNLHLRALEYPEIREDLKLSEKQIAALTVLTEKYRQAELLLHGPHRKVPEGIEGDKVRNAVGLVMRECEDKAIALLVPEQAARLEQIGLQSLPSGLTFLDPGVIAALKLSEQQVRKFAELNRHIGELYANDPEQKNRPEVKEEFQRKQFGILTPAQLKKWKEMLGRPLKGSATTLHSP